VDRGPSLREEPAGFEKPFVEGFHSPGPGHGLGGRRTVSGVRLFGEVGHGRGNKDRQIGWGNPPRHLKPLGGTNTVEVVRLVVNPMPEEGFLLRLEFCT
jgi:hypothetical protein